jgi:uncharacterized membrane protein
MSAPFRREPEETDRLLALSDAVVGIAITLLVLEITVPTVPAGSTTATLPDLVAEQWHEFLAYVLSFLIIGQYWVLHRRIFVHVDRHDRGVLWLNLLFLLMVAFVPYATSLFTTYPDRFGVTVYAGVLATTGLTLTLLWGYASRNELLEAGLTSRTVRIQAVRFLVSPVVFVVSMAVATVSPPLAIGSWLLLVPLNGVFEARLVRSLDVSAVEAGGRPGDQ